MGERRDMTVRRGRARKKQVRLVRSSGRLGSGGGRKEAYYRGSAHECGIGRNETSSEGKT